MCYWLLPESGIPIARTTIQAVAQDESDTTNFPQTLMVFDEKVGEKLKGLSANADPTPGFHLYREYVIEDI
jgi:hypothetical protein